MLLELTAIGQLEFVSGFISCSLSEDIDPPPARRGVISTALFLSAFSERSDAARALGAASGLSSFSGSSRSRPKSDLSPQNLLRPDR